VFTRTPIGETSASEVSVNSSKVSALFDWKESYYLGFGLEDVLHG